MINIKKGPGLSLAQVDKVGKPASGANIEAGQVVRFAANGEVNVPSAPLASSNTDLLGFAITATDDGDAIESGKIGVLLLDGASVIETDKASATVNSTNYAIGAPVSFNTSGLVTAAGATDRVIGRVEGIRNLPSVETINGVKVQSTRAFLGIKLAAI